MNASGTRGDHVTILSFDARLASQARSTLLALGYAAAVRVENAGALVGELLDRHTRAQLVIFGWIEPMVSPDDYFTALFGCKSWFGDSNYVANYGHFCDPRIDNAVQHAATVGVQDAAAAAPLWTAVDRELTNRAAIVPLTTTTDLALVSKRIGNYEHSPQWGALVDQMWVE